MNTSTNIDISVLRGRKLVVYLRISSRNQQRGVSLEMQEEICRKWCERHGIVPDQIFYDTKSAYNTTVPKDKTLQKSVEQDSQKMLALAIQFLATVGGGTILMYHPDRFSRYVHKAEHYMNQMKRYKISAVFPDIDGETLIFNGKTVSDEDKILRYVEAAERESDQISRRCKDARSFQLRHAQVNGDTLAQGLVPFGYQRDRVETENYKYTRLVEDPTEYDILKAWCLRIFRESKYRNTDEICDDIVLEANAAGILNRGRCWNMKMLSRLYDFYVVQIRCYVCGQNNDGASIMLCEGCMNGVHINCWKALDRRNKNEPEEYWCDDCLARLVENMVL